MLRSMTCNRAAVRCVTLRVQVPSFGKKEEPKFNTQGGEQMGSAKGANLLPGNGQMRMKQMADSIGVVTCASRM